MTFKQLDKNTNPFQDSLRFMYAVGQTTDQFNVDQFNLYLDLIKEEVAELQDAVDSGDSIEVLDALIDILVVTIGAGNSIGANMEGAWDEVMYTNFAKIDPETGKVRKREDGKVLKPEGWKPPQLSGFLPNEAIDKP
jgi:predicted HAD superfamily Cof-like phosphohydrolase